MNLMWNVGVNEEDINKIARVCRDRNSELYLSAKPCHFKFVKDGKEQEKVDFTPHLRLPSLLDNKIGYTFDFSLQEGSAAMLNRMLEEFPRDVFPEPHFYEVYEWFVRPCFVFCYFVFYPSYEKIRAFTNSTVWGFIFDSYIDNDAKLVKYMGERTEQEDKVKELKDYSDVTADIGSCKITKVEQIPPFSEFPILRIGAWCLLDYINVCRKVRNLNEAEHVKRFHRVVQKWKEYMNRVQDDPMAVLKAKDPMEALFQRSSVTHGYFIFTQLIQYLRGIDESYEDFPLVEAPLKKLECLASTAITPVNDVVTLWKETEDTTNMIVFGHTFLGKTFEETTNYLSDKLNDITIQIHQLAEQILLGKHGKTKNLKEYVFALLDSLYGNNYCHCIDGVRFGCTLDKLVVDFKKCDESEK